MMWWNDGGYGMFLGPLVMIAVLFVGIAFIALLVREFSGVSSPMTRPQAPLDILKERFAKGEIGKEEFEERRKVLGP